MAHADHISGNKRKEKIPNVQKRHLRMWRKGPQGQGQSNKTGNRKLKGNLEEVKTQCGR